MPDPASLRILNGAGTDMDRVDAVAALGFVFDTAEEYGTSGGDGTFYIQSTMLRPSLLIDATHGLLLENRVEWEWFDHQL
ncbi:hypothetical protein [Curtobacterium sp. MCBD17_028]|uniref:hypothetical protein n=1 Tax=Curtobacterium sp. MCBD17_028 TaxID=2175670 RepID=UPI000DA99CAB|nr:hypothetical protein [Curtobacterium sp. MCBD17_028]PZE27149.1 hypothetical protein DEI86_06460 [Curtobacterium sp. MCBD17_028]